MVAVTPQFQLNTDTAGTLGVSGVLSFATATGAWQAIRSALGDRQLTCLDLAGVRQSDSAGLSCVVAVVAESVSAGRPVQATHIPASMLALARVCEVDRLRTS